MRKPGNTEASGSRQLHWSFVIGALPPAVFLLLVLSGCSCHLNLPADATVAWTQERMLLSGHSFDLRFSRPAQVAADNVLVIYATGDGGWLGLGTDIFDWIAAWHYPIAGFSARSYVHILGHSSEDATTTPGRLVSDYEEIIAFAEKQLGLAPTTKVILVGMSRGAGLSVVAAGAGGLSRRLAGLLAIALTKEEEHVLHQARIPGADGRPAERPRVMIETYNYLDRISPFPVMVIQSTNDGYLTADEARKLFGPDTPLRRLRAVPAANHSFRNGCGTLYQDMENGLRWITSMVPAAQHH